ncbi:MAG TPA: methionyl-tRNA formyltransferase, partial [Actinomycetota bacterium]|nr:methionyl-tRNA formyltransferase [Actinomycetota bacterium]
MAGLRAAFLGNDPWSVPSLRALAGSSHQVALVLTRTPRPGRRGAGPEPTAVSRAARDLGLPLLETPTVKEGPGLEELRRAEPGVVVVVAYGEILPPELLRLAPLGAVNVHFSLLPELRGAAPVQHAILRGLERTGVTTIQMDEGLDTGPILLQAEEPVREEDDAGSLGGRLAELGGRLLVETLDRLARGDLAPRAQDHDRATQAPKLRPEDRWIDWARPTEEIVRLVRALSPEPGAATTFRDGGLKVLRAGDGVASAEAASAPPGTILGADDTGVLVRTGDGIVRLIQVAPAGRRRMAGAAFVRGHRPRPGERLGG